MGGWKDGGEASIMNGIGKCHRKGSESEVGFGSGRVTFGLVQEWNGQTYPFMIKK